MPAPHRKPQSQKHERKHNRFHMRRVEQLLDNDRIPPIERRPERRPSDLSKEQQNERERSEIEQKDDGAPGGKAPWFDHVSDGEGGLGDRRVYGLESCVVDALGNRFSLVSEVAESLVATRERISGRDRVGIVAAGCYRAIPEIALVVVFQNWLAGEQHKARSKAGGNNAYHDQVLLS
jgi:hypothetical protein